ncbi:hypothetical protein SAMN05444285_12357 [Draconibacterium orientale]|uniref:Uncharacterized protein n=1 Tax=Draconibacterium orientale TaxID=1168034 RepID=X5E240_9BACT|nr:hypothetical protein [Draconibacterium orientale]AHW60656.1 hypothetical protein FH5T_16215 [Draconibacterium orientale]SET78885.1 hypothetical protein SAMN05444285_12357 [Draconibacterium orientale]
MVTIVDFKTRMNAEGEPFLALVVQGGIELVKSKETGMYYATAKKASIPSTFDEKTAESLIGQELEGTVQKMECDPYEFTNEETGEIMELSHRWVYVKDGETVDDVVHHEQHQEEPELV